MGAGTIVILLVVLVILAVAAFAYLSARSKLQRSAQENEAASDGDERPTHVAVGTPEQLDDLGRGQR